MANTPDRRKQPPLSPVADLIFNRPGPQGQPADFAPAHARRGLSWAQDDKTVLPAIARDHPAFRYDSASARLGQDRYNPSSRSMAFEPVEPGFEQFMKDVELDRDSSVRPVLPTTRDLGMERQAEPINDITPEMLSKFRGVMVIDEGDKNYVYPDSKQIPTVGIGHKVLPSDHLTLGQKINDERKKQFFVQDADEALHAAIAQASEAGISDPAFIARLGSVNFQLGKNWTQEHKKTWELIKAGDYEGAAQEAARSRWFTQTPDRVIRFQEALRALPRNRAP